MLRVLFARNTTHKFRLVFPLSTPIPAWVKRDELGRETACGDWGFLGVPKTDEVRVLGENSKKEGEIVTTTVWKGEHLRGRKQRRNVKELYGDVVHLGYTGSYDRVAAFARVWREHQQEASRVSRGTFVPLTFSPGEAFQFDWSEDWAVIGGKGAGGFSDSAVETGA